MLPDLGFRKARHLVIATGLSHRNPAAPCRQQRHHAAPGCRGAARSVTKPRAAAQRSRAHTSSTCSRFSGDQVQVKEVELARALTRAAGHLLLDRPCSGWQRLVGTNDVPRRSVMTRLIALLVALVFVLGA